MGGKIPGSTCLGDFSLEFHVRRSFWNSNLGVSRKVFLSLELEVFFCTKGGGGGRIFKCITCFF